jgi:hypothetical protein
VDESGRYEIQFNNHARRLCFCCAGVLPGYHELLPHGRAVPRAVLPHQLGSGVPLGHGRGDGRIYRRWQWARARLLLCPIPLWFTLIRRIPTGWQQMVVWSYGTGSRLGGIGYAVKVQGKDARGAGGPAGVVGLHPHVLQ